MNKEGITTVVQMKDDFRCLSCTIATINNCNPGYLLPVIKESCGVPGRYDHMST